MKTMSLADREMAGEVAVKPFADHYTGFEFKDTIQSYVRRDVLPIEDIADFEQECRLHLLIRCGEVCSSQRYRANIRYALADVWASRLAERVPQSGLPDDASCKRPWGDGRDEAVSMSRRQRQAVNDLVDMGFPVTALLAEMRPNAAVSLRDAMAGTGRGRGLDETIPAYWAIMQSTHLANVEVSDT